MHNNEIYLTLIQTLPSELKCRKGPAFSQEHTPKNIDADIWLIQYDTIRFYRYLGNDAHICES
jgi:hypothetical protein